MQPQDDILLRNTHVDEFLPYVDVGGVLLEPDFAVFDVEVENGVIDAAQASPADAHQLIMVADGVEEEFVFNLIVVGFGLAVSLQEGLDAGAIVV